jgi:hypothetical protein
MARVEVNGWLSGPWCLWKALTCLRPGGGGLPMAGFYVELALFGVVDIGDEEDS